MAIPFMFSRENATSPRTAGRDAPPDRPAGPRAGGRKACAAPLGQLQNMIITAKITQEERSQILRTQRKGTDCNFSYRRAASPGRVVGEGQHQVSGSFAEKRTAALSPLPSAGPVSAPAKNHSVIRS